MNDKKIDLSKMITHLKSFCNAFQAAHVDCDYSAWLEGENPIGIYFSDLSTLLEDFIKSLNRKIDFIEMFEERRGKFVEHNIEFVGKLAESKEVGDMVKEYLYLDYDVSKLFPKITIKCEEVAE